MAQLGIGKESTFGRGLQRFISNALPYASSYAIIDDVKYKNPRFKDFYKSGSVRSELLKKHSVIAPKTPDILGSLGSFFADKSYNQLMYATLDVDKGRRLRDYRVMAAFAEVSDALDEICDEFLCEDDNGDVIRLGFNDQLFDYKSVVKKDITEEFNKFINIFNFKENGWEYMRQLLVDGELFFENIVHKDYLDHGILGLLSVPNHLMDPVYDNYQNMSVRGFLLRKLKHHKRDEQSSIPTMHKEKDFIALDKNQVTYINSGVWNEEKTFRVPFIENARRAYRQLTLVEDAIIIYRLVRAPERLIFNVDVGNLSTPKAEAYLKQMMNNYWSKKTFNLDSDNRVNAFNPQSMLDAFWFAKKTGSEGTTVTTLPGGANLGQLDDLVYFVKKLYKSLKVPTNRADIESTYTADATVLREELKFAHLIIRFHSKFARGIKDSFITHLKLRKMWDRYELRENSFDLFFTPPRNYNELRRQQILDLKLNNFNNITANEAISKGYSQKMYLGWTDEQILSNREWLRKDAALQFELDQIRQGGEDWASGGGGVGGLEGGGPPPGGVPDLEGGEGGPPPPDQEGGQGDQQNQGSDTPRPDTNNPPEFGPSQSPQQRQGPSGPGQRNR